MNIQEALNVLGLSGDNVTEESLKAAKKKLSLKYHPDRNPNGAEIMKAVNAAFDFLEKHFDKISQFKSNDPAACYDYGEELSSVLEALNALTGVLFEVIGNWVWIGGETKEHKAALKELGCKWAPKKKQWFYRPEEHKCRFNRREHSLDDIRSKYGSNGSGKAKGNHYITA